MSSTEVDYISIFKILRANKLKAMTFVFFAVVITSIYITLVPKMYEAKAIIEIGTYRISSTGNAIDLEPKENVVKRLFTRYVLLEASKIGDYEPQIDSVEIPKKTTSLIELVSRAKSNELAVEKLKQVFNELKLSHDNVIENLRQKFLQRIKEIDIQLARLKDRDDRFIKKIKDDKNFIDNLNNSIVNAKPISGGETNELVKQSNNMIIYASIAETSRKVSELEHEGMKLEFGAREAYLKERNDLQLVLTDFNLRPTKLVGGFLTYDYPSSPKVIILYVISIVLAVLVSIIYSVLFTKQK